MGRGVIVMLNLASNLSRNVALLPQRVAIRFGERSWTWAEFDAISSRIAHGLAARGVTRGDHVALACPNLPWFPFAYYAILKLGAVVVPINVLLNGAEIAYHLQDSQAKAFLCFEGTPELALGEAGWAGFREAGTCEHFIAITIDPAGASPFEGTTTLGALMHGMPAAFEPARTAGDDTAVILYTSGTTGRPKGAELTHANVMHNAQAVQALTQQDAHDVQLICLPLFHSFGQVAQMNCAVLCGASMVLMARFDPDAALGLMEKHAVTMFSGVPTMYIGLLNVPDAETRHDLKQIAANLRIGISGGAAIPVEVIRQFEARFEVPILEGYGLSETSPVATFNHLEFPRIPGSVGQPLAGVEVRVVDPEGRPVADGEIGEIAIRGHNIMKGYWRKPEATAEAIRDGWFHSGDLGKRDADGNFYIVDRLKDMVIRGGFNVYPRELEEVLMTHPAVVQVAVLGVPDATHGEEVKAVIVARAGAALTPEAVIAWCKERMAAYKYPRIVEIVEAMPMTATGKILKRAMRG
jgi:long-chain acyl-CoA synthetase